ncbi:MAG: ABC transporter permease [Gammaproteobacteria bacterium]|nr:ABC transporter permease [Gammaproteobacteria bacterium]
MKRRTLDIILYRTYAELKSEAQRTYIGVLWWILEPVVFMLIFYFIFGVLFQRGTEDFVPFLLIGLALWHWFQATVMQCSGAISANRGLIQQVYVPNYVFPTVVVLANGAKFVVVLVILFVFLYLWGITPTWHWLESFLVLVSALCLTVGIAYLFAAITPLLPDMKLLLQNGLRGLFFLSGIFFDLSRIPEPYAGWLRWNPVATVVDDLRNVLMREQTPAWDSLLAIGGGSLVLIFLSLTLMRHNESRYAKSTL